MIKFNSKGTPNHCNCHFVLFWDKILLLLFFNGGACVVDFLLFWSRTIKVATVTCLFNIVKRASPMCVLIEGKN